MGSLLAAAVTRAHDFLLEPMDQRPPLRVAGDRPRDPIEVSVLGTCAGCGVTTVASGLALTFASHGRPEVVVREVALPAADVTEAAGTVVLVTPGGGHPPIASLVGSLLRERSAGLLLVANKVTATAAWSGHADLCLPESRFGAALVARGRRPPGAFGAALERLAALVGQGPAP